MKCLKCDTDNLLKDRADGLCKRCKHPIVFDPRRTYEPFNDKQFAKSLDLISKTGTLKFTTEQFHYFINSRCAQGFDFDVIVWGLIALVFVFVISCLTTKQVNLVTLGWAALFTAAWSIFSILRRSTPRVIAENVSYDQTVKALQRWELANGKVESWLGERKLIANSDHSAESLPAEILDYSFDRLVVTQSDEMADFLIANKFHFENNCAVLSIDKYPQNLFPVVMQMLRNNADLKVYVVHDASWLGLAVLDKLSNDPNWFAAQPSVQIIDLGLRHKQFKAAKKLAIEKKSNCGNATDLSATLYKSLDQGEEKWLNNMNTVRLDSIAPNQLMRMIALGIAASRDPSKKDSLLPIDSSSGVDGGLYVFSSDSFG